MQVNFSHALESALVLSNIIIAWATFGRASKKSVQELHLTMNSRLDELLRAKSDLARGEGHAAGLIEGEKRKP